MVTPSPLKPEVLGQLLLMQSVMGSLPDEKIFEFVSTGLRDVPGIQTVEWHQSSPVSGKEEADLAVFAVGTENSPKRTLVLGLSEPQAFIPYREYIKNFCFTLSILLEERNQRRINQSYRDNLERRVAERTAALEKEIGERKKAEEALFASEELFRTSFEYAAVGECLIAPDGRIRKANSQLARILGYKAADMVGRPMEEYTHPEDKELTLTKTRELLDGKAKAVSFEKRYIHSSGQTVWAKVGSFLFRDRKGVPQYYITHVDDITNQKMAELEKAQLEEQLRQAHKMEALGTLAGGIAHDFNNILAAIIGYTDLAIEDTPPGSPAEESLLQIQKASRRAKDLVQQILSFSRKQSTNLRPLKLPGIVRETLRLLRATIPATIEIRNRIESDSWPVMADAGQVNQILMNLCSNAAHSMEENGGVLTVELCNSTHEVSGYNGNRDPAAGEYVVLTVSDTGVGMDLEQQKRIFDPYYTTKEVGKGSGMGLSVVLGLVKGHDGAIQVESQPGRGSVFKTFFPRVLQAADEKERDLEEPPARGQEHILVVDDEQSIVDLLERSIRRLGYRVTATTSSMEALEFIRAAPHAYDLLISDLTMPQLTGERLCRKLASIRPGLPIIMCTGYSSTMDVKTAQSLGIDRFLQKPVPRQELAIAIRDVLDCHG